jgi:hypothetical protein
MPLLCLKVMGGVVSLRRVLVLPVSVALLLGAAGP